MRRLLPAVLLCFSCGGVNTAQPVSIEEFSVSESGYNSVVFYAKVRSAHTPVSVHLSYATSESPKRASFNPYYCSQSYCEITIRCTLYSVADREMLECLYPDNTLHAGEIIRGKSYTFYLKACVDGICDAKSVNKTF